MFDATGGTVTTPGDGYKYWTFNSSGTLTVISPGTVEYLVVAGGGARRPFGSFCKRRRRRRGRPTYGRRAFDLV
jgi:hypothetical protein